MLMHHADACVDRLARRPPRDIAQCGTSHRYFDAAPVGRVHAREHSHQGGLAGAILAHERVNLA